MKRPTRFALVCLLIGIFCGLDDVYTALSQSIITIPIYHVGFFTILWTDYLLYTTPVTVVWLVLSWATWAKGIDA